MTDFYCPVVWRGGFYTFEEQSVCCAFPAQRGVTPLEYVQGEQIRRIKESILANKPIGRCATYCQQQEQEGIKSLRQNYLELYEYLKIPKETTTDPTMPQVLEVRLGNLCNYACRMCEPKWSSSISKEIKEHPHLQKHYVNFDLRTVTSDQVFIEEIKKLVPGLKMITFTGGEPTITRGVIELIDYMVETDHAKNIRLHIVTNCSAINPHLLDRLEQFRGVQITASLDGIGTVAEYQRHGTDWPKVETNVHAIGDLCLRNAKVKVNVNVALTAYNVLDLANFTRWYLSLYDRYGFTLNVSFVTDHLSTYVLAGDQRIRAIRELTESIELMHGSDHPSIQAVVASFIGCRNRLTTTFVDATMRNKFVKFTKDLDQARGENFEKIFHVPLDLEQSGVDKI